MIGGIKIGKLVFPQENNLVINYDIGNPNSYSGSGTELNDLTTNANTCTLTSGSMYSSDGGGSLVFDRTQQGYISPIMNSSITDITTIMSMSVWGIFNKTGSLKYIVSYGYDNGINGGQPLLAYDYIMYYLLLIQ